MLLTAVFDFPIESNLHLGLLEQHLFSELIQLFLILYRHCVCHASDLVLRLHQILAKAVAVSLHLLKSAEQFTLGQTKLMRLHLGLL